MPAFVQQVVPRLDNFSEVDLNSLDEHQQTLMKIVSIGHFTVHIILIHYFTIF